MTQVQTTNLRAKGFLASLFDFSFKSIIASRVIRVLYVLWMVMLAFGTIGFTIGAFEINAAFGAVELLIVGPSCFLFSLIFARVLLELVMAIFAIQENTNRNSPTGWSQPLQPNSEAQCAPFNGIDENASVGRPMALTTRHLKFMTRLPSLGRRRAGRSLAVAAIATASLFAAAVPAAATAPAVLGVVIAGSGTVTSQPAGIACPGKCTATFAEGASVVLTPQPKNGSTFLRWGGSCTGTGACTVKVTELTAVAAQFLGGPKVQPQPTTAKYVAVPGRYAGWENNIVFYVAPGGKSVWNIEVPASLVCTPSGTASDTLTFLEAAVQPGGSFNATRSVEELDTKGGNVKVTYTIAGHIHPASSAAPAGATGTWRENVGYPSQPGTSCTSNEQSWTATLTGQALGQETVVEPGSYAGWENNIVFSVAPGGRSMLDITAPSTLVCAPSGSQVSDHLTVSEVAVMPDGSFTSQTSQEGVLNGTNAKFTYTFAGHFEDPPGAKPTAAGIWREVVVSSGGTTTMCDSGENYWEANLSS